jgi:hypothetical protein
MPAGDAYLSRMAKAVDGDLRYLTPADARRLRVMLVV